MLGLEQTAAWLLEPYNQTALTLLIVGAAVVGLALAAGLAAAIGNWRLRRRSQRQG